MSNRRTPAPIIGLVLCLIFVALAIPGAYVGCYLWRGEYMMAEGGVDALRVFPTLREASFFAPASVAETWLWGEPVRAAWIGPPMPLPPESLN